MQHNIIWRWELRKDFTRTQKNKWGILLGVMLLMSFLMSACSDATIPVSNTTTANVATLSPESVVMKPVVDKFLTNLPASYYSLPVTLPTTMHFNY
jgi:hypothetical protein